mgnify:CR=1 FL=1
MKRNLLNSLADNIFKTFTEDEEKILHSKHGKMTIHLDGVQVTGLAGAFKIGLPLVLQPYYVTPIITEIDWNKRTFKTVDNVTYLFEFTPINLYDTKIY